MFLILRLAGAVRGVVGEGMPRFKNFHDKGNLFIKFDVQFPDPHFLTDAAKFQVGKTNINNQNNCIKFIYHYAAASAPRKAAASTV